MARMAAHNRVQRIDNMAEWLTEDREWELTEMWQIRQILFEVLSNGYSNLNLVLSLLTILTNVWLRPAPLRSS